MFVDQDDLSVVSLDELSSSNSDTGFSDNELNDFVSDDYSCICNNNVDNIICLSI